MRTGQEMMETILTFANNEDSIRIVSMEGSRLNRNVPKDNFQDFDIGYTVTDIERFKNNEAWLDVFGKRVIMQKPEAMLLFPPVWLGKCNKFSYLMVFEDGNKLDLSLIPLNEFQYYLEERDSLFKILLDKDNRCPVISEPSDINFHVKKPGNEFVDNCCNEFWLLSTYVTKGLCRKELLYAVKHLNLMKEQMFTMISWKVGIETGFSLSVGKAYKYLDKYVSKEIWLAILQSYKNETADELWDSLIICCNLFQEAANFVTRELKYQCPGYNKSVINYITRYLPTEKKGKIKIL